MAGTKETPIVNEPEATTDTVEEPGPLPVTEHSIKTEKCGIIKVFVQGDLDTKGGSQSSDGKCIFLTVHDMGSNHTSMMKFMKHPCMYQIASRAVFLHVVIPGQEPGAPDLGEDYHFPKMQEVGCDLVCVLDQLKVKLVVGLGEGAGANILARFGMVHPSRCLGLVLVHPTSTTAGVMEQFKDKIIGWKLENIGHNPTTEQYLVFHKFGHRLLMAKDKSGALEEFKGKLNQEMNPKNLKCYVESFKDRTDISSLLEENLKCDTMLVLGDKSSFLHTTETMYQHMDKTKTSILRIDDVGDVLEEAPGKVAQSLLLFCQGLGLLTSLSTMDRMRTLSNENTDGVRRSSLMSMEEYDRPNMKRFSHSAQGDKMEDS